MIVEAVVNGPIRVIQDNLDTVVLCRCGLTKTSPFCDDSHLTYRKGMTPLLITEHNPTPLTVKNLQLLQDIHGNELLVYNDPCDDYDDECCGGNCQCHQ